MLLNETLAYMAALVRENPNITVREIATEMMFADNKSIYYWLSKGNYRGLGEFKQDILKENSNDTNGIIVKQNQKNLFLIKVPMRDWHSKKTTAGTQWFHMFHEYPNSRGLFAITLDSDRFAPWFIPEDILVINTALEIKPDTWALLKEGRNHLIGRVGPNNSIHDANTLKHHQRGSADVLGPIIKLHRVWS